MKCTACDVVMEKGIIANNGMSWVQYNRSRKGFWEKFAALGLGMKILKPLVAWKCPQCQRVQLSVEVD